MIRWSRDCANNSSTGEGVPEYQLSRSGPVSSYLPPATAVFYTFSMYTLLTIRKNVSELDLCLFFSSRLLRFTLSLLLQLTRLVSVYQKNTTSDILIGPASLGLPLHKNRSTVLHNLLIFSCHVSGKRFFL